MAEALVTRLRFWWLGRLLALAKWLQRRAFAIDLVVNAQLDRMKPLAQRSVLPYDATDQEVDAFFAAMEEQP